MSDLRPRLTLRLGERRFRHLTPSYIYWRLRLALEHRRHPDHPYLTADAIRLLEARLRPDAVGAEWGSGNSTAWFAARTRHLTSFETDPAYHARVGEKLRRLGLTNVDQRCTPFEWIDDEPVRHAHAIVRGAAELPDDSLDYALVDTAPRACVCAALVPKIRRGGMLVLDNANWYLPPPDTLRPAPVGSTVAPVGFPGGPEPTNQCMPAFLRATAGWDYHWTTDGVCATLFITRP